MPDCRTGRGADCRGQGGGEDETRSVGTHRIDQCSASGDIAAKATEGLGQGAFDHVDSVHGAVARCDARTARAIHADGMDLVEIGHRAVSIGQVTELADGSNVATHRVNTFEDDQLRSARIRQLQ